MAMIISGAHNYFVDSHECPLEDVYIGHESFYKELYKASFDNGDADKELEWGHEELLEWLSKLLFDQYGGRKKI
jgi:hypothetical protein